MTIGHLWNRLWRMVWRSRPLWLVLAVALGVVNTGCASDSAADGREVEATTSVSASAAAEPTSTQVPPSPLTTPTAAAPLPSSVDSDSLSEGQTVAVTDVIDGDTIDTTAGRVRVIGIDTPERGECNFGPATSQLRSQIAAYGNTVVLVPVSNVDDTDRYGRLLRYIDAPDGTDLGRNLIASGLAIARYDSRDGYARHPRQDDYIALDAATPPVPCGGA